MLSVLGLGAAYPETIVDNQRLTQITSCQPAMVENIYRRSGVSSRATVMSPDYLKQLGLNKEAFDPISSFKSITQTPTQLLLGAATKALEAAKVKPEELGLIIGDTSTPYETTPSEGQRIGKALGIARVPAYDITASSIAIPLHISTLLKWKEDRVPSRVLIVTANTPTQVADYRGSLESWILGDGAFAAVLSTSEKGILRVVEANYTVDPSLSEAFSALTYGSVNINLDTVCSYVQNNLSKTLSNLADRGLLKGDVSVVGPELNLPGATAEFDRFGIAKERRFSSAAEIGYSFGSAPGISLCKALPQLRKSEKVILFAAGVGLSFGYVVFEVE